MLRLRFPEFEGKEEWKHQGVKGKVEFQPGFPFDSAGFNENGAGLRLIRNRDLKFNDRIVFYSKPYDERFVVKDGDILIGMDGDFTPCLWSSGEALLNQRVGRVSTVGENDLKFFYYFLTIQLKAIEERTARTTVKHLSHTDVEKIEDFIPVPKEQQKIASCLSSLDDLITAHSQKLEALKAHKKGLMQQLFPAEGETEPRVRFKEFEGSGEWEEKSLGEVCRFVRGPFGGALKKEIFVAEGYAVYEQSHAIYDSFDAFRYFISEEKFQELKRFSVSPGDIIMSCSGTMGKFAIIPKAARGGVINQALLKLTVDNEFMVDFIKMSLELHGNQEKLLSQSAGGAIKNVVSVDQIKELKLFIPSKAEQQKIASCLSSLDALIAAHGEKVEVLKEHKKGLMQGLFPMIRNN